MPTDYTSKEPFYIFLDTLEEQEAALATNPLIQRLIESRECHADVLSNGHTRSLCAFNTPTA